MGEWAPPFYGASSATPSTLPSRKGAGHTVAGCKAGANENHSQLGALVMRIIRI